MKTTKLINVLRANGIFSLASGLLLTLLYRPIAELFEIENQTIFQIVGVGLILFSGLVLYQTMRKTISKTQIQVIIFQDWAWVVASIILLVGQFYHISLIGQVIIASIAIVVGVFALLQNKFLSV